MHFQFFTILFTLLIHLVGASTIESGGVPILIKDFLQIGKHLIALDANVKHYMPGLEGKLGIEFGHVNVELSLIQATKTAKATPHLKEKESEKVTEVALQMQPVFESYLHDVVVKKPEFKKGFLYDTIRHHIQKFQDNCHKLAEALEEKVSPEDGERIAECVREIDEDFERALKAYKGK
ncbi:hypothetical protein BBP40_007934 [Aspergillus hancockii]|nr:hypothetical protein BBP40_007934 [Aspergillus hancockii]